MLWVAGLSHKAAEALGVREDQQLVQAYRPDMKSTHFSTFHNV